MPAAPPQAAARTAHPAGAARACGKGECISTAAPNPEKFASSMTTQPCWTSAWLCSCPRHPSHQLRVSGGDDSLKLPQVSILICRLRRQPLYTAPLWLPTWPQQSAPAASCPGAGGPNSRRSHRRGWHTGSGGKGAWLLAAAVHSAAAGRCCPSAAHVCGTGSSSCSGSSCASCKTAGCMRHTGGVPRVQPLQLGSPSRLQL